MRASELLGLTEARVRYNKSADGRSRVARIDGQPITLRLLHNMRIRRDRRNAELAAQSEFVKQMYGPKPGDEQQRRPRHAQVAGPSERAKKPQARPNTERTDATQTSGSDSP